eukprot:652884_1
MAIQDTFASFNMTTAIFVNNLNNDAIPIPIPSGNGDWGLHGCLTNIGDQFLVVLGGGYNEVKKQANNAMMGAYEKDDKVMVVENAQIVEKEAGEQYVVKENNETEMGTMEGPQIGRDEFIVEDNIITPIGNEVSHESRSVEIMEGVDARKSFVVVHRDDETPIEGPQINRDEFIIHAQEEIISLQ